MIAFNLSRKQIRKEYWRKQNDEKLKGQNEREKKRMGGYSYRRAKRVDSESKRLCRFLGFFYMRKNSKV